MDLSSLHRSHRTKWRRKPTFHQNYRMPLLFSILTPVAVLFYFSSESLVNSLSALGFSKKSQFVFPRHLCGVGREKFMWYAPHSGFSNQLSEFKNAVLMAGILNRTLIMPPVLDHHAVALGSCPKFRVLEPSELRFRVWNHSIQLLRESRYLSMADVIDLSSLTSNSDVKFIDFRNFVSLWCGVDLDLDCSAGSRMHPSLFEKLKQCGLALSGYSNNHETCLYASQEDCRTTVWTYQNGEEDGILDSFQADNELKKKRKISFSRKRRDVYKALGPGSEAEQATVLAFGSLFTAPYKASQSHVDIQKAPKDERIQSLIQKIEFLPFVSEILTAGKSFALEKIKAPFLCAQLRLLDGQFKNHWRNTFGDLKQKLELLKQKGSKPIHVFVMTDLPRHNWTGTYLGDLAKDADSFKLFFLYEEDEIVSQTAKKLVIARYSMKLREGSYRFDGREHQCSPFTSPDILLYIEETICSCASLGFVGTTGSTIAESIDLMRRNKFCST